MIAAHHLSKNFGNFPAVDSIDFRIPRGQVTGFLGPNGAGKTTTIRMIAGFLPPTAGTVTVDGQEVGGGHVAAERDVRRLIGYLPESAPLYTEMRVVEFLGFRARLFGVPRNRRKAAIDRVLEMCWLGEVAKRPIHQLSKGFRQRVGLAAAMVHEPPVLVLDEPTVGLDPSQIREVRGLIRNLAGEHTILLSTHILPEVELVCDRLIMIARGRIRAQGTVDELRQSDARHRRYVIETSGERAAAVLRDLPPVRDVEETPIGGAWHRLIITAGVPASSGSGDLAETMAACLAKIDAPVRELRREAPSLEHLFVRMMADAETDFATRDAGDGPDADAGSTAPAGKEATV